MQSVSYLSVKWEPNNFRVASYDSDNLQVVSYKSTSQKGSRLWVNNKAVIKKLYQSALYQVCTIILHYFKLAFKTK